MSTVLLKHLIRRSESLCSELNDKLSHTLHNGLSEGRNHEDPSGYRLAS